MRVLVLGEPQPGSLAERASLRGTYRLLRSSGHAVHITASCGDPDTEAGPDTVIASVEALHAAARDAALVIVHGDPVRERSLLRAARHALWLDATARRGTHLVGLSLAMPARAGAATRWVQRRALRSMSGILCADPPSLHAVRELGNTDSRVSPDPAFLLPAEAEADGRAAFAIREDKAQAAMLIGVAPVDLRLPEETPDGPTRFVETLAASLDRLVALHRAKVLLMPTRRDQLVACERVAETMHSTRVRLLADLDPAVYKCIAHELGVMIAAERHAAILAASVGTPVIGLDRDSRIRSLIEALGAPHRSQDALLFARAALVSQMVEHADHAIARRRAPLHRIEELRAEARADLRAVFRL